MQFILENTSDKIPIPVPVPSIARWVETKKSPSDLGPLIGMKYVQNVGSMGRLLEMLRRQGGQKPVLNLDLKPTRYQRNEANIPADIDPDVLADDFIRKFVARFLFRKTVRD
ncbi:hypothetical protein PENSUB_6628 [Penicillium subrubescens]|uniref:Uncharacterized protein n=1 Tax=Penicillium subrubescens TaxID=1316194 RepID=A0A1Q5U0A8_9EURO|nr:hypothetical protein PENSUB_6628 [Penicillium subrubescens]